MITIGIDPGLTGALSFIGRDRVSIVDIPTKPVSAEGKVKSRVDGYALATLVRQECPVDEPIAAFCESVSAWGTSNNAIEAQASLVGTLRAIEAVFDVLRIPLHLVSPQDWQGFYGLKGKKHEQRERGALPAAIVTSLRLYPGAAALLSRVRDHNRAEALLIGHYGLRKVA